MMTSNADEQSIPPFSPDWDGCRTFNDVYYEAVKLALFEAGVPPYPLCNGCTFEFDYAMRKLRGEDIVKCLKKAEENDHAKGIILAHLYTKGAQLIQNRMMKEILG